MNETFPKRTARLNLPSSVTLVPRQRRSTRYGPRVSPNGGARSPGPQRAERQSCDGGSVSQRTDHLSGGGAEGWADAFEECRAAALFSSQPRRFAEQRISR